MDGGGFPSWNLSNRAGSNNLSARSAGEGSGERLSNGPGVDFLPPTSTAPSTTGPTGREKRRGPRLPSAVAADGSRAGGESESSIPVLVWMRGYRTGSPGLPRSLLLAPGFAQRPTARLQSRGRSSPCRALRHSATRSRSASGTGGVDAGGGDQLFSLTIGCCVVCFDK